MSLLEYLDRVGKHVSAKTLNKYGDEKLTYNDKNANGIDFGRYKKAQKKYNKSDKGEESYREYQNQLCCYNGETLTLVALSLRFQKKGFDHPVQEAKKYLL